MNNNKIRILADVLAPFAVVMVTVALFFIFMPEEPGTLFWTNMVYSALLEIILFAYIVWLPSRGTSVALKWMCGIYSIFYICVAVVWMLLFSVLLCHWLPIKVYFAVIAVITGLWILLGALSLKADNTHHTSSATLADNRRRANEVSAEAEMFLQQFELLAIAHPELKHASISVRTLCRGLASLSPVVMAQPFASKRVKEICSGLEDILAEPVTDTYSPKLKDYADNSIIVLNNLKKSVIK